MVIGKGWCSFILVGSIGILSLGIYLLVGALWFGATDDRHDVQPIPVASVEPAPVPAVAPLPEKVTIEARTVAPDSGANRPPKAEIIRPKPESPMPPLLPKLETEPTRPRRGATITRLEDRAPDLSGLSTEALVKCLAESIDKIEKRKAAKIIGDRHLRGELALSEQDKVSLEKTVVGYLKAWGNDGGEAQFQIERLWRAISDNLIAHVDDLDIHIADAAFNMLMTMQDDCIVRKVIQRAREAKTAASKTRLMVYLRHMRSPTQANIEGRTALTEAELDRLYRELVEPALKELNYQENRDKDDSGF